MRKKHFLLYYDNRIKEIIRTTPRTWAKANPSHFPNHTFVGDNHPTVWDIEEYLCDNYGFVTEEQDDFFVTFNFSQKVSIANGLPFILEISN